MGRTPRFTILWLLLASLLAAQGEGPNISGGPLIPEQAAVDVASYDLSLEVFPTEHRIEGTLTATVRILAPLKDFVLDLDTALQVRGARLMPSGQALHFQRKKGRIWVRLPRVFDEGEILAVAVDYGGMPRVARRPPWDGGFTWSKTPKGLPWIATSCQGEGADLWWPCKDQPSDEPDIMDLRIIVPQPLVVASNGTLRTVKNLPNKRRQFHWHVANPINNYGVAIAVAPYVEVKDVFSSIGGEKVPVTFFALPSDEKKARALMPEILDHLRFFEENFGPYPFRNEKYGVAETPFLGMEHQTLIAYGYGFRRDPFDYDWLHHHELSHEWFGNLITCPDWRDMWLHEGIGTYTQALYVEEKHGLDAYLKQMKLYRRTIANRRAIAPRRTTDSKEIYFGPEGGSDADIYYKGAWVLHTLRFLIGREVLMASLRELCYPDEKSLRATDGSQCRFRTTEDFRSIVEHRSGMKLDWFFDVYLRQPELPKLSTQREGSSLKLSWTVPGGRPFPLPVEIRVGGKIRRVPLPNGSATVEVSASEPIQIDPSGWILR